MAALPVEIWERIFEHLPSLQDLLRVRLVCRRWKTLADRKRSLWNRVCVRVPDEITMDGSVVSLAPAVEIRLNGAKVASLNSWWPSIAERLTGLRMEFCSVSARIFSEMLEQAPNLERMLINRLRVKGCSDHLEAKEFRLEKVKNLHLITFSGEILDFFTRKCPHLRELILQDDEDHDQAIARLVDSVQGTVERLQVFMTPYLLQKMSMMERLRLKSADLTDLPVDDMAVSLSRFQPSLEEFNIIIKESSILCEIGRNLPRLKRFVVHFLSESDDPPCLAFLATMPLLEKLEIGNGLDPLNFNDLQCPNLRELVLDHAVITSTLRSFLTYSRNLQTLKFLTCAFDNWSDLLAILTDHPSLQQLDLWFIQISNTTIPPENSQLQTNLRSLQIYSVTPITNEMLLNLLSATPKLVTLKLISTGNVDDATLSRLCRLLSQLIHLELGERCPSVTGACAADLLKHCPRLERLEMRNCQALEDAVRRMLAIGGRNLEINPPCRFRDGWRHSS